jgi:hypothetical protein
MSGDRKKPVWPWIEALLIGLMVLYVISSGPMRRVISDHSHQTLQYFPGGPGSFPGGRGSEVSFDCIMWLDSAYWPLYWASEHTWAEPLNWYWSFFPIPAYY